MCLVVSLSDLRLQRTIAFDQTGCSMKAVPLGMGGRGPPPTVIGPAEALMVVMYNVARCSFGVGGTRDMALGNGRPAGAIPHTIPRRFEDTKPDHTQGPSAAAQTRRKGRQEAKNRLERTASSSAYLMKIAFV